MGWVTALHSTLVAVDTAPLIYYVEANPDYLPTVDPFFAALNQGAFEAVTSLVSLAEVLVHPLRTNDTVLANKYRALLLNTQGITTHPFTQAIAERTAQLRAAYRVRTPDAIQIATALHVGATHFVTNDDRLPTIPGLTMVVLKDVIKDNDPDT